MCHKRWLVGKYAEYSHTTKEVKLYDHTLQYHNYLPDSLSHLEEKHWLHHSLFGWNRPYGQLVPAADDDDDDSLHHCFRRVYYLRKCISVKLRLKRFSIISKSGSPNCKVYIWWSLIVLTVWYSWVWSPKFIPFNICIPGDLFRYMNNVFHFFLVSMKIIVYAVMFSLLSRPSNIKTELTKNGRI